ncbi:hypothetical protein C8K30_108284 [Promicromonospora sp. AC04]|uniref:hypothetical protein n=1 Tax=Promicromonospora sp. AC04 TaxID=2135723 RepID=UPI000D4D7278|nr:hypothetical protein [Promicromonospora sp. AC04]PUB25027.1 hypothetical protein C8K30_108284 [Promicromonospora sp. AC04]
MIGIPPLVARVRAVIGYDPVFEYGILPRPDLVVGAVDVAYEGDDEAGFTVYLGTEEPIEVEAVSEQEDE